ncbi:PilZ domain-containing protein [candidate division FCPU426 bacterium]|nr:PilZ domain-containing protein [candidate division FCPU426 bacterium]
MTVAGRIFLRREAVFLRKIADNSTVWKECQEQVLAMGLWTFGDQPLERRRYPRKPIHLWAHCAELKNGNPARSFTHPTEDLSAGGLAMRSSVIYRMDQCILATLLLPPSSSWSHIEDALCFRLTDCQPVGILSRVVWCASTAQQYARVGVEFSEVSASGQILLRDFFLTCGLAINNAPLFQ